ncbi:MAG: FKBP-type peptidyl-prolyl cis-trans isomerase [Planctomycetota bacterium]
MRQLALLSLCICAAAAPCSALAQGQLLNPPGQATSAPDEATAKKNGSYGIGFDIGRNIRAGGFTQKDLITEEIMRGLMDGWTGKEPTVKIEDVQAAMQVLVQKIMARKLEANKTYLAENKKKEGFQSTNSGLQYRVITQGTGATPTASSQVSVHYEGKLTNGRIFDSSIQRGQPATFGVSQVIPGWTEALLRMKVGDKWELVIPSNLAYGERGSPGGIGPNEILIFQVELLEVK